MTSRPLSLSPLVLLVIYAIAPVLLLVVVFDLFVFGGALRALLPATPQSLFWFAILFNVPHHIASLFSLADPEYLSYYKSKLMLGLPLLLLGFGALLWYSPTLALIVFILYTEYHVMSQHQGIAVLLSRSKQLLLSVWKWTGLALLAIGYGLTNIDPSYSNFIGSIYGYELVPFLIAFFIAVSAYLAWRTAQLEGRWFIAAAALCIVSAFGFLELGYTFFAFLVPRFVHDVAAFAFYMVHDHNRNREGRPNLLYRLFSFTKIPVLVLVPLLAVGVAYLVTSVPFIAGSALLFLFMSHYYVESFVWKREGIHRKQILLAMRPARATMPV